MPPGPASSCPRPHLCSVCRQSQACQGRASAVREPGSQDPSAASEWASSIFASHDRSSAAPSATNVPPSAGAAADFPLCQLTLPSVRRREGLRLCCRREELSRGCAVDARCTDRTWAWASRSAVVPVPLLISHHLTFAPEVRGTDAPRRAPPASLRPPATLDVDGARGHRHSQPATDPGARGIAPHRMGCDEPLAAHARRSSSCGHPPAAGEHRAPPSAAPDQRAARVDELQIVPQAKGTVSPPLRRRPPTLAVGRRVCCLLTRSRAR